jgi:hypothetical protein
MARVNIIGLKELQQKIAKAPAALKQDVDAELDFAAEDFRTRAIKDAPRDTSFLAGEITADTSKPLNKEVISGSEYSAPMEFGTKGNFRPIEGIDASPYKGLPSGGDWKQFVENIKKWVKRKGIDAPPYVIAKSIFEKGVKPHPFFFKQIAPVQKQLVKNIENVLNTVFK